MNKSSGVEQSVARQAHNLKVARSSRAPVTTSLVLVAFLASCESPGANRVLRSFELEVGGYGSSATSDRNGGPRSASWDTDTSGGWIAGRISPFAFIEPDRAPQIPVVVHIERDPPIVIEQPQAAPADTENGLHDAVAPAVALDPMEPFLPVYGPPPPPLPEKQAEEPPSAEKKALDALMAIAGVIAAAWGGKKVHTRIKRRRATKHRLARKPEGS